MGNKGRKEYLCVEMGEDGSCKQGFGFPSPFCIALKTSPPSKHGKEGYCWERTVAV